MVFLYTLCTTTLEASCKLHLQDVVTICKPPWRTPLDLYHSVCATWLSYGPFRRLFMPSRFCGWRSLALLNITLFNTNRLQVKNRSTDSLTKVTSDLLINKFMKSLTPHHLESRSFNQPRFFPSSTSTFSLSHSSPCCLILAS